jgi:cell division protein FtsW
MWISKAPDTKRGARPAPPDRLIFWLAVALLGFGAVMVFSASAYVAGENYDAPLFFFFKQALFFLLGLGVLITVARVPYTFWQRSYRWWLLLGFVLLIVVLFVPAVRGARRWLTLGPLNLQVAEVFRFGMVVFMAATLARRPRCALTFKQRVLPHLTVLAVGCALLMLQPDFSSVVLLAATVVATLFFAGIPWRHLFAITVPAVILCALVIFGLDYKRERLAHFQDGLRDPFAAAYQVRQGVIHMGTGGLTGTGLGGGMAKFHYVPDVHTDFILASVGEELGFVATFAIVTAYALLLARGLRIAARAPDRFAALLAAGLTATLGIQMAVNLGVVLGLLPPTGLPLPLLSYGGSSALFTAGALAIILSVSRHVRA